MLKNLSRHLSHCAGCKSLLAILFFLCIYNSPVNAQTMIQEGEEFQFTFKDVAFDAYQMDGVWIDSNKKIVTVQYGGYNYFICCSSPYDANPVFIVMRSTDIQQLIWSLDGDGNILGYRETKTDLIPGLELMTPAQRQEYMNIAQAQCKNAILIASGRVKEQRQQWQLNHYKAMIVS